MSPDRADEHDARKRKIFRIALAVALGLTLAEAQEEPFSFLAPMFAFQLLMKMPRAPGIKQGVGFVLVVIIASVVALSLANSLADRPLVYLIILALIFFGCFLLQLMGKGGPLPGLLLICNAAVPVLAVVSGDLARDFVLIMIASAGSAVLLAWLAYAALPDRHEGSIIAAGSPNGTAPPPAPVRTAIACTAILMPAMAHYLAHDSEVSVVVLITIVSLLSQSAELRQRAAIGLLIGNLIGGVFASAAYYALVIAPSLPLLFMITLAIGLLLTEAGTRPIPLAGIFAVAMPTFLILLALGLTPIAEGSGAAFVSRIIDVMLASLYAVIGVILLLPDRPVPVDRTALA
nr:DUF2955 domain-containing protein [uncultured Dongia sp.]